MSDQDEGVIKPVVDKALAAKLILDVYGLTATDLKEFVSYDDKNFFFRASFEDEPDNEHVAAADVCQHGYVLKVTNSEDSKNPEAFEAQNEMILHIIKEGLPAPRPIKNKDGHYQDLLQLDSTSSGSVNENGKKYLVRCFEFIPGKILYDISPWTKEHFYQCGKYIAKMDSALQSFQHEAFKKRHSIWFLSSVPMLPKYLHVIEDDKKRALLEEIFAAYNTNIVPILGELKHGIIHGDFNEQNILVHPRDEDAHPGIYDVYCAIDFGDANYTPLVYELAITIMYMMTQCTVMNPNLAGGHVIAGYITERELPNQDPTNDYVLTTAKTGWRILDNFWNTPKDKICNDWMDIVKSYSKMFMLLNTGTGMYLDIPESRADENEPVIQYLFGHGGPNQLWKWQDCQLVSQLNPFLCLGVLENKIVLRKTNEKNFTQWKMTDGNNLVLLNAPKTLYLTGSSSGHLTLKSPSTESAPYQVWQCISKAEVSPKPASSCHLQYGDIKAADCCKDWQLECTVNVTDSTDCTYFCVIGWGPGGYSGIQQIDKIRRVAIFSMWNGQEAQSSVSCISHGENVHVETFGGEGTGLKAMAPFLWVEGDNIKFTVQGEQVQTKGLKSTWRISCWHESKAGKQFMATYERTSAQLPLSCTGFYSFVEDWDRSSGAQGHKIKRQALFLYPKFANKLLKTVQFTRVENGADKFAYTRAKGGNLCKRCTTHYLSTGGSETEPRKKKLICKCP